MEEICSFIDIFHSIILISRSKINWYAKQHEVLLITINKSYAAKEKSGSQAIKSSSQVETTCRGRYKANDKYDIRQII